jgi:hypothetical protein
VPNRRRIEGKFRRCQPARPFRAPASRRFSRSSPWFSRQVEVLRPNHVRFRHPAVRRARCSKPPANPSPQRRGFAVASRCREADRWLGSKSLWSVSQRARARAAGADRCAGPL